MPAVPVAESGRVADRAHACRSALFRQRRQRFAAGRPGAAAQPAIDDIHALMREHGVTLSELGAACAVSRIHELALYGSTLDELREVRITRCPSLDHDPRYQLPPGARVVGPFTAEWKRLRRGRP
ncbi:hypothetical protein [Azohydromonas caseinilytica]|uniref:Uncharacterized protein n=1 Tax=Azohydromonas caseinilytica TaxID=2728836 RepID=A0A848FDT6_9BURK|nr:hypothetical protein [Azohydromonas caseinilytica]NML16975.1 hypothetical protein [Azohydromonas caseinilytica]